MCPDDAAIMVPTHNQLRVFIMTHALRVLGITLLAVGLVQIGWHMSTADTMVLKTCLGSDITLNLGGSPLGRLHCWGCYAAVAGIGMAMLSFLPRTSTKAWLRR